MLCAAIGAFSGAPPGRCLADTQTCVTTGPVLFPTHRTCVSWSRAAAPEENIDFRVDYDCPGCAGAPAVTLITGDADPEAGCGAGGWHVWARLQPPHCRVPCPALDLGAVSVDPTTADDFDVTIAHPSSCKDGARNVGSIILVPAGDNYSSLHFQSIITNNLTGPLTVKQDSAGNGGDLHLLIEGDMSGAITAATITDLEIRGNLSGPIEAVTITYLEVDGDLTTAGDISITGDLSGDVSIGGDVKADIDVAGDMVSGASISVTGHLAGEGRIRIDGLCDGPITIGKGTAADTFIRVTEGLEDGGSITINDSEGKFDADGDMRIGSLQIFPALPVTYDGFIRVNDDGNGGSGDLNGDIRVNGCHDQGDDAPEICILGDIVSGSVVILQPGCPYPVGGYCCDGVCF